MTTNSLNNTCLNDFSVTSATTGVTRTLTVSNTVANVASAASQIISVAGTSAGDPYTRWAVGTTTQYALGIDNSDSDALTLTTVASGATPSSTIECIKGHVDSNVHFPGTSQFNVQLSADAVEVTGDDTRYKCALNSERFDTQGDFDAATNFYFTAPVAGKYFFTGCVQMLDTDGDPYDIATARLRLNATTDVCLYTTNLEQAQSDSASLGCPVFDFIDLAANDTIELSTIVSGGGGDGVSIRGGTTASVFQETWLTGVLFG